jgi:predicted dehydrogenase
VIVTTPEIPRLAHVRVLAAAGKHLLLEKPMAASVAEADEIIRLCRDAKVRLMLVQSQRYRDVNIHAKRLIDEDAIGPVRQVRVVSMLAAEWSRRVLVDRPFYRDPRGTGLLVSQLVHNLDMMRWLAGGGGTGARVFAVSGGHTGQGDLSLQAQFAFDSGVMGQAWVCMETPGAVLPESQFRSEVIGERGMLAGDAYEHLDRGLPDGTWQRVVTQEKFDPLNPADPVRLRSFSSQNQEFVDCIRERREPEVTGRDGRASLALSLAALESGRTGQVVRCEF